MKKLAIGILIMLAVAILVLACIPDTNTEINKSSNTVNVTDNTTSGAYKE